MTATRFDRGSTLSTTIYSEGGDLAFERTFDAPRDLVWRAFTIRSYPALVGQARHDDDRRRDGMSARGRWWR
jgi:hypothetical protein